MPCLIRTAVDLLSEVGLQRDDCSSLWSVGCLIHEHEIVCQQIDCMRLGCTAVDQPSMLCTVLGSILLCICMAWPAQRKRHLLQCKVADEALLMPESRQVASGVVVSGTEMASVSRGGVPSSPRRAKLKA